jgi:hypothetical protein
MMMNFTPFPTKGVDIITTSGARDIAKNLATLLMGVDPLAQRNQSQHGGTQKTSAKVKAQKNWEVASNLLMLEDARIVTNPHTGAAEVAYYPPITKDWSELNSNAHVAQLSPALSGLLKAVRVDRDSSVHFLDKTINKSEFSQLAAKIFTQVITKRSSLDNNTSFRECNQISILMLGLFGHWSTTPSTITTAWPSIPLRSNIWWDRPKSS